MRYQISGRQIDIGEALQTHVKEGLGEAVSKYAERPTDANVIFSRSAHEYVCETIVHLSTGLTAQARAHATEIYAAFDLFAQHHPWVGQQNIRPKSIAREMAERFYRFEDYVKLYRIERVEGLLLRYLSDVYGTLLRSVPDAAKTEDVLDVLAYLRDLIARVDSSLLEAWESRLAPRIVAEGAVVAPADKVAQPTLRELRGRVRAELHKLVRALADVDYAEAASCLRQEGDCPWDASRLEEALEPFYDEHERLRSDGDARRADRTVIKPIDADHWQAIQVLCDPEDDNNWYLEGIAELGAEGPSFALRKIGN